MKKKSLLKIIGAGLAGVEAAWQAAQAGIEVELYEMRPKIKSPAHHTDNFAELVCSNSFGSLKKDRAAGLLQHELRSLNSLVVEIADKHSVPAGGALAVDRGTFSAEVTRKVTEHPLITVKREEISSIPDDSCVVLSTGPLTSDSLAQDILKFTGIKECHFYDAASPIISGESINFEKAFLASRYDKGGADYINCPLNKEQYFDFCECLVSADQATIKDFEKESANYFEACLPIEEIARRGKDTLRFGPLKPKGLWDPRWGDLLDVENRIAKRAFAVAQLRKEDINGRLWNMVGFQTNLKWGEQTRVFRMIPGLENAEFIRYGVMHRNTFINSPHLLKPTLQFSSKTNLFAAGQLTGTEGYLAAVAGGWLAGTNAALLSKNKEPVIFPSTTMIGALINFITNKSHRNKLNNNFQPIPPNFGIISELSTKIRNKKDRYAAYSERALKEIEQLKQELSI